MMTRTRWALTLAFLAAATAGADWPTYRGHARRAGCADGQEGPKAPAVLWALKAKEHFIAAPVPYKDRLLVSGLGFVNTSVFYCLDTAPKAKERIVWQKGSPLLEMPTVSSPAVAGGAVVFGDGMHQTNGAWLYALDVDKGGPRWQRKVEGTLVHLEGAPTVAGGRVYIGGGAAGVLCLDPAKLTLDGKELTPAAAAKAVAARRAELQKKFEDAKKQGDMFAVPPGDHDLPRPAPALAWQAGKDRWHVDAPLAVVGERVLAASAFLDKEKVGRRAVFCLDAKTGKEKWQAALAVNPWGGPSVEGQTVVVTGSTISYDPAALKGARGAVTAFDLETGQVRWKKDLPAAALACAALTKDTAVVPCSDGKVRAYHLATGALRWTYTGAAAFFAPAALGPAVAYVADLGGVVHAIDLKTGAARWKLDVTADAAVKAPGMVYGGPVLHGGRLYLATCNVAGEHANKPTAVVCVGEK